MAPAYAGAQLDSKPAEATAQPVAVGQSASGEAEAFLARMKAITDAAVAQQAAPAAAQVPVPPPSPGPARPPAVSTEAAPAAQPAAASVSTSAVQETPPPPVSSAAAAIPLSTSAVQETQPPAVSSAAAAIPLSTSAVQETQPPAVSTAPAAITLSTSAAHEAPAPAVPAAPAGPARAPAGPGYRLMGRLDISGGQYFYKSQAGAFNGYGVLDAQLAKSNSASSGHFFSLRTVYTGFKQVNELAGGGTLFQQSLDNTLGVKWIRRYEGGWALKPRLGVKNQLFRETKDEKWGKGLYDFNRYEAGLTLERKTRLGLSTPWTYQLSWDVYYTRYTRFKTLASQYGQELAAPNPGSRTLDTVTNQLSYDSGFDLPNFVRADLFAAVSLASYRDQKVINSNGVYLPSMRSDSYQALNVSLSKRYNDLAWFGGIRPVLGAGLGFANLFSNQNHLDTDPARLKFIRSYYDYREARLAPTAQFTFIDTGLLARLSYEFSLRAYPERPAQKTDGAYTSKKLKQYSSTLTLEASYPVLKGLDANLRGSWDTSRSNNRYEQVYRYNYESSMYFAGLEWRF